MQKDQLLMRLDGAGLEEDFHEQQALVETLSLQAERLQALIDGRAPNFAGLSHSQTAIDEQMRMYETMRDAGASARSVIDEQMSEKQKTIERLKQSLATASSNLGVAEENSQIYADLNQKGLTSRTNFFEENAGVEQPARRSQHSARADGRSKARA